MKNELPGYDAIGLSELIRKGEITPVELLDDVIRRIEKVNPRLNAVIYKMYDEARRTASDITSEKIKTAPFPGIPFLLKDLSECKGAPLSEGSRALAGNISKIDTELVRRYKAGGLIPVGKTNTSEFGLVPTTEPLLFGPTHNPWNPELTPGGSSGGSAAAVAAGIVPMAHGSDGGGSIRIPSSCCGTFGLKPSRGRNTFAPLFGDHASGIAYEHALTRTVRDSAALLDLSAGPAPGDPYVAPPNRRPFLEEAGRDPDRLKIGFLTSLPEGFGLGTRIHSDCEEAVRDAAQLCESLGHTVEEASPGALACPNLYKVMGRIFACLSGHIMKHLEKALGRNLGQDEFEPETWMSFQTGLKISGPDYLALIEEAQLFSRKVARWYVEGGFDMLLTPTLCTPPVKLGSFHPSPDSPKGFARQVYDFLGFTYIYNLTGQPAMSVPLFWNKGNIPIGTQFAARYGHEDLLFQLASQLERARPWAKRKPPIHC